VNSGPVNTRPYMTMSTTAGVAPFDRVTYTCSGGRGQYETNYNGN